ncbi:histone-lysine N-methyltransferase PR-Set7 isoform X1 [Anastrepha ludens]|uniref:histone-lysine N-methyltransferase PR-Set7 isoform X1 n=1 Tax=Anastrepha ludens TaxID=28586 RepID=UPI0023AEE2F3|nr:histone-lysine N-methyltransferase PR-Set7 isoform X1 [Anastrepha ludens]XP_053945371.1 histone-lysine N-methyltransferase PR-Set7 isoform X1 [Anastrepha ludens]XP_053945372.1 histone-lysine N-methyltransferase PR-Set7 isoform X1 [Anastrepha ludens]
MVRRRAIKATTLAGGGARSTNSNLLENGELKATVGCTHLEEQYFASPKRKDCKVENCSTEVLPGREQKIEKQVKVHGKTKSSSSGAGKARSERGGITGRTIGVPLATRSQTRTIENFYKVKIAADNTKLQESCQTKLETANGGVDETCSYENLPHYNGNVQPSTPVSPNELNDDTNDSEYSAQLTDDAVFGSDFLTHRSQLRDSHSSTGSACTNASHTENIFLQEPVLTLNIDKTPNQSSYFKIRTSLEVEPIFSSPPALTSVLNGRFNQIVTLNMPNVSSCKHDPFFCETGNMALADSHENDVVEVLVPEQDNDNDNSSCDSGVAFTTSLKRDVLLTEHNDKIGDLVAGGQTRRRKPATPHRIVCPSPIKTMPHVISPTHAAIATGRISSPSGRKLNKEQLSPRKSPRQMINVYSKSRRRLNQQNEFSAINDGEDLTRLLNNGIPVEMNDNNVAEALKHEVGNYENLEEVVTTQPHKCTSIDENIKQPHKPIAPKTHVVKTQPHKSKYQNGLPLAATNNNHGLKEFFPVRRSVRKTKTAVKEEMMRSLEKAVIEERAEGLKVAHFEGKGRGVIADRHFQRGEFVVEYIGDLISMTEASEREKCYALDENAGCYMYYFKHKNQQYCIDATEDTGKLGRLVNHSRNGNLVTKVVVVKQRPHLILLAKDDIEPGEELTYDYGDRSKESLLHHPWLAF